MLSYVIGVKKGLMANFNSNVNSVPVTENTRCSCCRICDTESDEIILHSKSLFLFNVDKKAMTEAHFTIKLLTGLSNMIKCHLCDNMLKLKSQIYTNCFQSESPKVY